MKKLELKQVIKKLIIEISIEEKSNELKIINTKIKAVQERIKADQLELANLKKQRASKSAESIT